MFQIVVILQQKVDNVTKPNIYATYDKIKTVRGKSTLPYPTNIL